MMRKFFRFLYLTPAQSPVRRTPRLRRAEEKGSWVGFLFTRAARTSTSGAPTRRRRCVANWRRKKENHLTTCCQFRGFYIRVPQNGNKKCEDRSHVFAFFYDPVSSFSVTQIFGNSITVCFQQLLQSIFRSFVPFVW